MKKLAESYAPDPTDEEIDTSEIPELEPAFFETPILTLPGEDLISSVAKARLR